jgi:hypothetical protein
MTPSPEVPLRLGGLRADKGRVRADPTVDVGVDVAEGPRLLTGTPKAPRWTGVLILLGLAVGVALLPVLLQLRTHRAMAMVLGPTPDGRTAILVDGDGGPRRWRVSFDEAASAPVGSRIDVELRGSCRCEPYPPRPRADLLPGLLPLGCFSLLAVFVARGRRRIGRVVRGQAAASAALVPGAPRTAVRLRPRFTGAQPKRAHLWLEVVAGSDGAVLGWVEVAAAQRAFDPRLLDRLVGSPLVGSPVVLEDEAGTVRALAVSPLSATAPDAAGWSDGLVSLLGWDRPLPAERAPVGGTARVTLHDLHPGHERVGLLRAAAVGRTPVLVKRARRMMTAFGIVGGLFIYPGLGAFGPLAHGSLAVVARIAVVVLAWHGLRAWIHRWWVPGVAAEAVALRPDVRAWAPRLALLLVALLPDP